jgi:hypothetical protein
MVWMPMRIQAHARLKLAQLARDRPDVVIMGQSRLGKVRATMFRPYTCYNLSRVSWPFDTYPDILRHFPEGYRPKLILVDADFFMFGPKYTAHYAFFNMAPVYGHPFSENLIEAHNVATQLLQHPRLLWQRTDYTDRPARGISAILGEDGFFKDGSERVPAVALLRAGRSPEDIMFPEWKEYITGGDKMGEAEMTAFKQFADVARQMGIPVVAVQMPMYGPAVRVLEKDPNYRIIQDFRDHVAQGYFDRLGIPFFDYMNFPPYSEDYRYFYDAAHPGGPLTEAVIASLASDPRVHALLPRLDPHELQRQLDQEKDAKQHILLDE